MLLALPPTPFVADDNVIMPVVFEIELMKVSANIPVPLIIKLLKFDKVGILNTDKVSEVFDNFNDVWPDVKESTLILEACL